MSIQSETTSVVLPIREEVSSTVTTLAESTEAISESTLRLRLTKPKTKSSRRVSWTTDTVDNEFMNKKKSKCCCVYHKPKNWDESSSEDENDDEECEHCKGHKKSDYNSRREKEKCTDESSQCNVDSNDNSK
ncbi:unnamed protein product [Brachionus calyciflorus]|uniref:E3 ubiquitin-protein ligase PPP1R11 n=1 Tax=Brachionus calyciflorus TaxID=104777 RepID=A0A813R0P1_9BILA|nr:unnamed protein product [Brachionus calyciflorus]